MGGSGSLFEEESLLLCMVLRTYPIVSCLSRILRGKLIYTKLEIDLSVAHRDGREGKGKPGIVLTTIVP